MSTAKIVFPVRYAIPGPEFSAEPLRLLNKYAFREDTSTIALLFSEDGEGLCRWLADKCERDGKLFFFNEFMKGKDYLTKYRHWIVDADNYPLALCGCSRVAEVIRDLLNKYKPELSR